MKAVACLVIFLPLICSAADPSILMAEGTTWKYDLVQQKPSESLDLAEPNEQEEFAVIYRLGGIQKVDNKDLRRLEIYRGDTLESVDLVSADASGMISSGRMDADGNVTKFNPPQQLIKGPFEIGTSWNFDGTIGPAEVSQHYEIAGEEDVDVPAGKFRAWRIHCEQILPTPAAIDRWFVPGTGFVKVETVVKGPSGGALQKTSMKLLEPPKIVSAPAKHASPGPEKLSAGSSSEPKGEFKNEFKSNTPAIYARWHGHDLPEHADIRAVFIAENVADIAADYAIDDSNATTPTPNSSGTFTLSKPDDGWIPGNYRIEFFVNDELVQTVKFKISK